MIGLRDDDAAVLARWAAANPVEWVREVLGFDPTPYQADILESVRDHRKVSRGSCHSAGKSGVAGVVAVWFLCAHPGSIVITTAPTFRQVRGILWDRIRASRSRAKIPLGGSINVTRWTLADGWFAEGVTAPPHDPDKFQGFHSESGRLLCIVDEAAGLSQTLYDGGVMPITVGEDDRLLLIGNTTSTSGEFRQSSLPESGYDYKRISAFDTPNFTETGITIEDIRAGDLAWQAKLEAWRAAHPDQSLPRSYLVSPAWVADRFRAWGEDSVLFQTRVLASFLDESATTLVPQAWIERAQTRWSEAEVKGRPFDGLDVAMGGADESILGRLEETKPGVLRYRQVWALAKNDTTTLVSRTRETADGGALPRAIAVDTTGVGMGVADALANDPPRRASALGAPVRAKVVKFVAGGQADDPERFPNRRSETAWRVRQLFERDQIAIDPADHELAAELRSLRWGPSKTGKHTFILEPKADFKKRFGRSPDRYDALSYAVAAREATLTGFAYAGL